VRLLVTRPDPDGERTARSLRARGHEVTVAPLLLLQDVDFALPDAPFGAVVMTSANAARAVARHPRRETLTALPAFTVGRHSAQAAHAAGFSTVHCAEGDKQDLVELLLAHSAQPRRPLLYLAGEDRAGDLDLAAHGIEVKTAVVYRAVKAERLPPPVVELLTRGALDGVLHFSKRSAEGYLECAERAGILEDALRPLQYCLSQQVAAPLAAAGAVTKVALRPEEAALIELVALSQVS